MREICEGEARDEDEALLEAITHIMVSKTDEEKKIETQVRKQMGMHF